MTDMVKRTREVVARGDVLTDKEVLAMADEVERLRGQLSAAMDREAVARAVWETLMSDYTFDEAQSGAEKAAHAEGLDWVYSVADAAISALRPEAQDGVAGDTELLDLIQSEYLDVKCFSMPTGGDDADVGWTVVNHHVAAPHDREVATHYADDVREALRAAFRALSQGGK